MNRSDQPMKHNGLTAPALPKALIALLRAILPPAPVITQQTQDRLSRTAGSYLLCLHITEPLAVLRPAPGGDIPPGWHLYAGSAKGPGGMAARVGRHLRKDKPQRWHIDALTLAADALYALPFPAEAHEMSECTIIARLLQSGAFSVPVAGFGSSDCRTCPAHLLSWNARLANSK